jgi:uncharacterized protein YkwD
MMTLHSRAEPVLILLLALLASCAAPPRGDVRVSVEDGPAAVSAVSRYRVRSGLTAVALDPALTRLAADQARSMAERGTLGHEVSGRLRARLVAVGIRDVPAAENLGRGHTSLERALQSWQRSPEHERNLRLAGATRIGIARADAPGGPWWAFVIAGEPTPGVVWR